MGARAGAAAAAGRVVAATVEVAALADSGTGKLLPL